MSRTYQVVLAAVFLIACGTGGTGADSATTEDMPDLTLGDSSSTTSKPAAAPTTPLVPENQDPPSTTTTSKGTNTTASPDYDQSLQPLVDLAIADLAVRLGVAEDAITVTSAEAVVWPDGSLGCPQPGMGYTQVQVDGTRIVLSHDGVDFHYHSGDSRSPFLCE